MKNNQNILVEHVSYNKLIKFTIFILCSKENGYFGHTKTNYRCFSTYNDFILAYKDRYRY